MSGNLVFGQDRTTNSIHALACDSNGHLDVNLASLDPAHGLATEAKQDVIIGDLTDGTQLARCMGSEDPNDPAATQLQLHLDGSGNVQTNIVNTVNIAPANNVNSGITNDPANSVAVGLRARTDIADATTETFLLTDSNGHLQVDVLSGGGGGDATAANQSLQLAQETVIATNSSSIDNKISQGSDATLTNAQQVLCYGRDSGGTLDALSTDASGHLEVQTNRDEVTITQSAVAVTSPNTFNSTSVDMRGYTVVTFVGNSTNSTDLMNVQYSIDDTTFYDGTDNVIMNTNGDYHITISATGARYLRISQATVDSGANMTITCISSKK